MPTCSVGSCGDCSATRGGWSLNRPPFRRQEAKPMPMQHAREGRADSITYPSPSWKVEGSLANLHGYSFRMEPDGQSNLDFGVSARIEGRDGAAPAGPAPAGQPLTAPAVRPAT